MNESDFQSKHTNNKAMEQTDLRTTALQHAWPLWII
jgi:hypothetical protein